MEEESAKKHRMIGSLLALILGVFSFLGSLGSMASEIQETGGVAPGGVNPLTGLFMFLGAVAYRSRKRRLLGLRPDTQARVVFEIACLALITLASLPLLLHTREGWLLVPLWALLAYPCAGLRIDTPERDARAARWTGGPAALAIAFVLGAVARFALVPTGQAVESEPARPAQAVLNAVRPLGLAVSMGQPFEVPASRDDEPEWFVSVECGIADGEARRLAAPTPGERWLFGVLWGDGPLTPPWPRTYVQPLPRLTLSLSYTADDVHEAAWAIFPKCPRSNERRLVPLWSEDAAMLIDGSGSPWMRADALGLPRDHPELPALRRAESFEELAESALPLALAFARSDDDLFIPVDGLVNGGPVFEVREFVLDSNIPNVPSEAEAWVAPVR